MKNLLSRIGTAFIIIAFVFFGLKSCMVKTWSSPNEPTTYAVVGNDGRMLSVTFLPRHEAIFLYLLDHGHSVEANLTETKGTYGTHYFWRLWGVEAPSRMGGMFGLRLYPEGFSPVVMETTVKRTFFSGSHKSALPADGERTYPVILFSENEIEFEGMRLRKVQADAESLAEILGQLRE